MAERRVRIFGAPPAISAGEVAEVAGEVARLRALLARSPGRARVGIAANPSGPLGTYAQLLLDGVARQVPRAELLPLEIRRRYARRPWFGHCLAVLAACEGHLVPPAGECADRPGVARR